jgi:peptide-methionine (S)-S-oxide reductase
MGKMESAIFGGGCFWCLEAAFRLVKGVNKVTSGYSGGETENPTYEQVSSGQTGHAEVVEIQFDPSVVKYVDLIKNFFEIHNPTTLNRQGSDIGAQYRSVIFYNNESQRKEAKAYIQEMEKSGQKIVTEIKELKKFWPAEEYHQRYFEKHPKAAYCQVVVRPKIEKLEKIISSKNGKDKKIKRRMEKRAYTGAISGDG